MHNGFSRYIKTLENFQNTMNKRHSMGRSITATFGNSATHKYLQAVNSSRIKNIHNQMNYMNQNVGFINNSALLLSPAVQRVSVSAVKTVFENHKRIMDQLDTITGRNFESIHKWHSSIGTLIDNRDLDLNEAIPESFNKPLEQLTFEFEGSPSVKSNDDIISETVAIETTVPTEKQSTWGDLIVILFTIWQFFYMQYADSIDSLEREKQLIETRKQTELMEKQVEIEKETLNLEQMRYEHQQQLEEKFDAFTETIEVFLNNQELITDDD